MSYPYMHQNMHTVSHLYNTWAAPLAGPWGLLLTYPDKLLLASVLCCAAELHCHRYMYIHACNCAV
jgi:hypothetical protein